MRSIAGELPVVNLQAVGALAYFNQEPVSLATQIDQHTGDIQDAAYVPLLASLRPSETSIRARRY